LEPEILLVDEVLAVGDASFQKKCLNKMQEVGKHGRTVFFVSHNMAAITRLCQRTILLDQGRVLADGPSPQVVGTYLRAGTGTIAAREWTENAPGNEITRLKAVRVRTPDGRIAEEIDIREPVGIEMEFEVLQPGHVLVPNYHFYNDEGVCAFITIEHDETWHRRPRPVGSYMATAWIPANFLAEGSLSVGSAVSTFDPSMVHFYEADAVAFQVIDSLDGNAARGDYTGNIPGVVRPMLEWTTRYSPGKQQAEMDAKERVS
jgi:lipopolysaccharide transport system ATP-binding protein